MKPIVIGSNNSIAPGTIGISLIGNNNSISGAYENTIFINCNELELTNDSNENNGKTIINDGALVIKSDGTVEGGISFLSDEFTDTDEGIPSSDKATVYYIDATSNNINITISHTPIPRILVRKDATGNTVTIQGESGSINFVGSINIAQGGPYLVVSDGTDLYLK